MAQADPSAILERLRRLQSEMSGTRWPDRRDSLLRALDHEFREVPKDSLRVAVAGLRSAIGSDGENDQAAAVRDELDAVIRERDELRARLDESATALEELQRLREENERLRRHQTTSAAPVAGGGFHQALLDLSKGRNPEPDELPLSEEDRRAFRAVSALFAFVVDYEVTSSFLVFGLGGQADAMGTNMLQGMRLEFRKRFRQAIEDPDAGVDPLKEQLSTTLQLLGVLANALMKVVKRGSDSMLDQLAPDDVVRKHTRPVFGPDFGAAFKTLSNQHAEVRNHSSGETWEIYFQPSFREEFKKFLEP